MPHVVLKGDTTVEDLWLAFAPLDLREGDVVYKASEAFLSHDKQTLLVRSLVVERDFPRNFFLKIVGDEKEGTMTLCIDKAGAPDRCDPVKRFIGLCAWRIMQAAPEVTLEHGNITELVTPPNSG